MKKHGKVIQQLCIWLFFLTNCSYAAWEIARPENVAPNNPFFQAGNQRAVTVTKPTRLYPKSYKFDEPEAPVYALSIHGSIKDNLERIMKRYRWRVIWRAPYDYNFDGRVTGSNLNNVVEKLLQPFPLQAVMYMSNRTMAVYPRDRYKDPTPHA